MLAAAVWARHVALVAIGDVEMLGEFFLAVLAEENVLRHGCFSGENDTPVLGAKAGRPPANADGLRLFENQSSENQSTCLTRVITSVVVIPWFGHHERRGGCPPYSGCKVVIPMVLGRGSRRSLLFLLSLRADY
jgi:hypothetical protein